MAAAQKSDILRTKNLTVGYATATGEHPIVSNISLELQKGQFVGLIGINGSGKSTLIRTLSGLQNPLSGEIKIGEKLLQDIPMQELAQQLSVVLTDRSISKNLSVMELVSLGRQPYTNWLGTISDSDANTIEQALIATDCVTIKDKKCFELSDGQLQRVLIARALTQDTDLILLDEPLSHLDLHHKAAILKLLKTIATEQQKTILFSTHDIEHILSMCDTLLVLQKGDCIQGTSQELIENKTLHALFPSEHIRFDDSTKRFTIE